MENLKVLLSFLKKNGKKNIDKIKGLDQPIDIPFSTGCTINSNESHIVVPNPKAA